MRIVAHDGKTCRILRLPRGHLKASELGRALRRRRYVSIGGVDNDEHIRDGAVMRGRMSPVYRQTDSRSQGGSISDDRLTMLDINECNIQVLRLVKQAGSVS
jgi:hypothetical protein